MLTGPYRFDLISLISAVGCRSDGSGGVDHTCRRLVAGDVRDGDDTAVLQARRGVDGVKLRTERTLEVPKSLLASWNGG